MWDLIIEIAGVNGTAFLSFGTEVYQVQMLRAIFTCAIWLHSPQGSFFLLFFFKQAGKGSIAAAQLYINMRVIFLGDFHD